MARVSCMFIGDSSPSKSAGVYAPKSMTSLAQWFKACRSVLPTIPDPLNYAEGWRLSNSVVTLQYIMWELHNDVTRERCLVIVDRNAPFIS